MRKIIHKLFWAWDFDKEEKWLNEMAAKGLALCAVSLCRYEFEPSLPGEYAIRMQMLKNKPAHPESEKYIEFIEETGAEHAGSVLNWVYFRKKTADGPFELFSDYDSRMKQLTNIIRLLIALMMMNLSIGFYNLMIYGLWGHEVSLMGMMNILLAAFMGYGVYGLRKKRDRLKKEQQVFEG